MPESNNTLELIAAIKKGMGDNIGFSAFFTVDQKGNITNVSPMFRDPKNIEGMIKTMLEASKALKFVADDMWNKTQKGRVN